MNVLDCSLEQTVALVQGQQTLTGSEQVPVIEFSGYATGVDGVAVRTSDNYS